MQKKYIILDDDSKSILKIQSVMERFSDFTLVASATTYEDGLNLILEIQPDLVFLEINPQVKSSQLSLLLINELHRYLTKIPNIIAVSNDTSFAFDAIKYDVTDFLVKPLSEFDLRKTFLRVEKNQITENVPIQNISINTLQTNPEIKEEINDLPNEKSSFLPTHFSVSENNLINESLLLINKTIENLKETIENFVSTNNPALDYNQPKASIVDTISANLPIQKDIDISPILNKLNELDSGEKKIIQEHKENERNLICIKSYGDYRFLELNDLAFLQADNNSTDITLNTGEQITAFKTLKYFEENLPSNFYRIHNSYIVNKNYISRIHTGNSLCYIKNMKNQIPFSKSYKDNIDLILSLLGGSELKES